jgi:ABC-2 type transport system ATP-binding protein
LKTIEVEGVSRVFRISSEKEIRALDNVNLDVKEGEVFGLLGPNGAGKTTLIKILATLLLPTKGRASVAGYDVVKEASKVRSVINLVSGGETPGYGSITTRENLWFFSQLYGLRKEEAKKRIAKLSEELGLEEYLDTRSHKLSTGYRQRLNLARGLINDPRVLFLDEPTLGLDVITAKRMREIIRERVRNNSGNSILITTHYMIEADQICDRIAIIDRGKIIALGTPSELKKMVSQQSVVVFEIQPIEGGKNFLSSVAGVSGYSQTDEPSTGRVKLKVVLKDEGALQNVIQAVSGRGKIFSLSKSEPSLEDVYIALVGKGFE